jgi:glycosyltransferase involved in cell wall biosynthesis
MFKVVVEATPILPKPSGVGYHILSLLAALYELQEQENFQLGLSYQPSLKNWLKGNLSFPEVLADYPEIHLLPLPVRVLNIIARWPNNPVLGVLEQRFERPDIYHGTNYAVYPCRHSLNVLNLYDLTFLRYPQYVTAVVRTYRQRVQQCLEWTDLIITSAESSKQEIIEFLKIPEDKIWVTPLASRYSHSAPEKKHDPKPSSLSDAPYILFVSTLEPRKNVRTLIKAFNILKTSRKLDHQLVLVGQKGWQFGPIFDAIQASPWRDHIHHLGYLSDREVAACYSHADVFAYPSIYEGFGLPVLEAMTLGCPVVTSNTSSLPEVAGDAALLVTPTDAEELAAALERVIMDRSLRESLIEKGYRQASQFSWTRTAKLTLDAYRSIL